MTSSGVATAVWLDGRKNKKNLYSSSLPAGGSAWAANLRVTDNQTSSKATPDLAVGADGTAYAVWADDRSGNNDIYFAKLPAGGSAWTANVKVSDDPGTARQERPSVAVDASGNVLVIWDDYRAGNYSTGLAEVRASRLPAGSSTWSASVVVADATSKPAKTDVSFRADGRALAVWADAGSGQYEIRSAERDPTSGSWTSPASASEVPGSDLDPQVAYSASQALLVYQNGWDIYARRSSGDDTTPPTVALTSPTASETVFASQPLTATASDDTGVASVTFYVDGAAVGSVATAPFSLSWDTTAVGDGQHTIQAEARDLAGNTAETTPIGVDVDNTLPADARVGADYAAGLIDVNEYALDGVLALGSPESLPARYAAAPGPSAGEGTTESFTYLSLWGQLSSATQAAISSFLSQPLRGAAYAAWQQAGGQAAAPQAPQAMAVPGISDPCVATAMIDLSGYNTGYRCTHDTTNFEITYIVNGTGGGLQHQSVTTADAISAPQPSGATCAEDQGANGVPDYIDRIACGLEEAWNEYKGVLGYPVKWTGRVPVSIDGTDGGQVLPATPVATIQIGADGVGNNAQAPYYLARHELFHVFQEEYESFFTVSGLLFDSNVRWWMEATADWAAGVTSRLDGRWNTDTYTQSLPSFFGRPSDALTTFDGGTSGRQYGSFVFAEYLVEQLGSPDVIKETWQQIGADWGFADAPTAIDAVARAHGSSLNQLLPDFAISSYLYQIDYSLADLRTAWATRLDALGLVTRHDDVGPARPARDRHDFSSDGETQTAYVSALPGGTAYVDLVPPVGGPGRFTVSLIGAPSPGPAVGYAIPLSQDASGAPVVCWTGVQQVDMTGASVDVTLPSGCRYVALVFAQSDYQAQGASIAWVATWHAGPLHVYQIDQAGWSGESQTSDAVGGWGDDAWDFFLPGPQTVTVSVQDEYLVGDNYAVYLDGTLIGTTPPEPLNGSTYSSGSFSVVAAGGTHRITIQDIGGVAYYNQGATYMIPAGYWVGISFGQGATQPAPAITAPSSPGGAHPNAAP